MDLTKSSTRDVSLNFHYHKLTIISNKCRYIIVSRAGRIQRIRLPRGFLLLACTRYCRYFPFSFSLPVFFFHRLVADRNGAEGKKGRSASNEPLVAIRRVWTSVPVQSHLVVEQRHPRVHTLAVKRESTDRTAFLLFFFFLSWKRDIVNVFLAS